MELVTLPDNQITCVAGEFTEVSQHDLRAGVVQDKVQRVAVQTELRVRVIHGWKVCRLRVRAAGRDKQDETPEDNLNT